MKIVGIIAEFNPFHNGHNYMIRRVKKISNADYVLVVMSGDFVQRGTPAIFDKYIRTEMALTAADLVIELPAAAATGSAQRFAEGGIAILNALGCVDELWFGSESGNMHLFDALASVLAEEPDAYRRHLQNFLHEGLSFPAARARALSEYLSGREEASLIADFLSQPNNILGLEYCLALRKSGSPIRPCTLRRIGSSYDDDRLDTESHLSSASAIRKQLLSNRLQGCTSDPSIRGELPADIWTLIESQDAADCETSVFPIYENDFSEMLLYQLLRETEDSLTGYLDIRDDLARRILRERNNFHSFSQFADLLKAKNFTRTQLNRALLHILLNIRQSDLESALHPAAFRILGFRKASQPLLTRIKQSSRLPMVTRYPAPASADLFASNLYEAVLSQRTGRPLRHEYTQPPVIR